MRFARLQLNHVNRAAEIIEGAGGKAINVAKVLQCLGEEALALGFAGGDRGEFLGQVLRGHGVKTRLLNSRSRTRLCTTLIDEAGSTVTELVEESPKVTVAECEQLVTALKEALPGAKALVMSGTIAPGGPLDLYATCAEHANRAGLLTVVDAQGDALLKTLAVGPGLVKPNRAELESTFRRTLTRESDILAIMKELMVMGAKRVVVTRGAEATLAMDLESSWKIESPRIKAVNPIGSGDSFTAALTAALAKGSDLGEACRCGAAAGAANALSWMSGSVNREDYARLLQGATVTRHSPG
jgi:tagatose 6-phosphate kinase